VEDRPIRGTAEDGTAYGDAVTAASRRAAILCCAILLGGIAAALSLFRVCDPDAFWHLKTGEVILETGRLVRTNFFSHSHPGHPWSNPEWLFQAALALVHARWGWAGVAAAKSLVVVGIAVALYALLLRKGRRPWLALCLVAIALAILRFRLTERPHLLSYLFFVLNMALIERYRKYGARSLWLLLPLYAAWGNVHPELILGLVFTGAVVAGDLFNGRIRKEGPERRIRPHLPLLLCVPAALANPATYRVLIYPFLHVNVGAVIDVNEFQHATLDMAPLFYVYLAVSAAAVVFSRERWDWSEVLPMAGMGLLAILYNRMIPYYLFVSLPVLHRTLQARSDGSGWLSPRNMNALAVLAAASALCWTALWDRQMPYRWGGGIREDRFPVSASRFIESETLRGNLYNHYHDGGYLIYRLFPKYPVFQDGRVPAYPRDFLVGLHARHGSHNFFGILEKYDVQTALVKASDAILFSNREWGLVYWDEGYAVLVRRTPASRTVLEKHEYRVFQPYSQTKWSRDPSVISAMVDEMKRNQSARLHPSGELARDMGIAFGQLGRTEDAEKSLLLAVRLSPADPIGWLYLGRARLDAGRYGDAIPALEKALRLSPDMEKAKRWLEEAGNARGRHSR
jgi:hypothetical protein